MSFFRVLCCWGLLGLLLPGAAAVPLRAQRTAYAAPDQLFAENKFNQARTAYMTALKRAPGQVALRLGLVRTLLRLDAWSEAITQACAAVAQAPQNAEAHGLLAMALMRGGKPDRAAAEANRALALNTGSYWGLVATGRICLWNNDEEQARKVLTRATTLHPDWPDAWHYLIDAYDKPEEHAELIRTVRAYLKLAPKGHPHDRSVDGLGDEIDGIGDNFNKDPAYHPAGPFNPAQLKLADDGKMAPLSVTFPIERDDDSILLPVTIDGERFHLLFDTGAATSITLGNGLTERLNLPMIAKSVVRGVSGKEMSGIYKAGEMDIGKLAMRSIPVEGVDTEIKPRDGLIGGAVFDDYAVTVDFEQNTMTLARGKNAAAPPPLEGRHVMTVPFHYYQGYILVPIKIQGQDDVEWGLLDTGASGMGVLSLSRARELGKMQSQDATKEIQINERIGVGTSDPSFTALLFEFGIELTLCNTERPKFFVSMSPIFGASMIDTEVNRSFDFQLSAIVGISYLTNAKRVTFDYPHHLLTLELPDIGSSGS